MSKIFRALVISAVATGVAAVVLNTLQKQPPPAPHGGPADPLDDLTEQQKQDLVDELAAQL